MLNQYAGVLILLVLAVGTTVGMITAATILGPKIKFPEKMEPFECGKSPLVSPRQRFSVKFYLTAVLFILFDIEAVFLYPWAALFRQLGWFGLVEMLLFIAVLGIGLLYVWKKGALNWE
jgi:NADH-quinone oxidoreductase subunit A